MAPNGYNLTIGGDGVLGLTFSNASRKRMSASAINRSKSLEWKAKASATRKKLWATPLYRLKTTKSHLGKHLSAQARAKVSVANKGKIVSVETGQKISAIKKLHWQNPEYRNKLIAAYKKTRSDPEYRRVCRDRTKKLWKDEEWRKRTSAAIRRSKRKREKLL